MNCQNRSREGLLTSRTLQTDDRCRATTCITRHTQDTRASASFYFSFGCCWPFCSPPLRRSTAKLFHLISKPPCSSSLPQSAWNKRRGSFSIFRGEFALSRCEYSQRHDKQKTTSITFIHKDIVLAAGFSAKRLHIGTTSALRDHEGR